MEESKKEEIKIKIAKFFSFFFKKPEEIRILIEENENYIKINLFHPYGDQLTKNEDLLKASEIIVGKIISKGLELKRKKIYLDVNNFKKNKEEKLKEIIKKILRRCAYKKEPFTFPPMNSYQRRLIHLEAAKYPDLTTESVGKEPERKVVVKPLQLNNKEESNEQFTTN